MAKIEDLTQEDVDKMEGALDRYKKENQRFRTERDEYKAAAEAGEVNERFKSKALQAEAKVKLNALGIKDPDRIVKYLSWDGVDFDDKDGIVGLDKSIETVKTDFPELFDTKRRVGGRIDAAADNPANMPKSVSQLQAESILHH